MSRTFHQTVQVGVWIGAPLLVLLAADVAVGQSSEDEGPDDVEAREAEMFGRPEGDDDSTADDEDDETKDEETSDETSSGDEAPSTRRERREAEMFGGDAAEEDASDEDTSEDGDSSLVVSGDEGGDGSTDTERSVFERLAEQDDTLAIGGTYFGRLQYSILGEGDPAEFPLAQPNILDLYLDGRPNDRLRLFVQGRLTFDPTVRSDSRNRFGAQQERLTTELDQLWAKFDVARTLFVTAGRQHVRWGVGRFWFPNDFLFSRRRDPVAIFDERTGVDMLRLHLPIESLNWNMYAVANLSGATSPDQIGGAFRSEFLVAGTEFALSAAYRKERPLRLGFDVSTGIWWFDLRGAVSVSRGVEQSFYRGDFEPESLSDPNPLNWTTPTSYGRSDEWISRALAGGEATIPYGAEDTMILGAEYFFNDFGYESAELYPWLIFRNAFRPFYVGRHYGALYASWPSPGRWDDWSITASTLGNLSDGSFLSRLDIRTTVLTHLQCYAFGSVTYGRRGEFRFRVDIPPVPAAPEGASPVDLSDGLTIPARRGNVGVGLQLDY